MATLWRSYFTKCCFLVPERLAASALPGPQGLHGVARAGHPSRRRLGSGRRGPWFRLCEVWPVCAEVLCLYACSLVHGGDGTPRAGLDHAEGYGADAHQPPTVLG